MIPWQKYLLLTLLYGNMITFALGCYTVITLVVAGALKILWRGVDKDEKAEKDENRSKSEPFETTMTDPIEWGTLI